jgi:uncharacterized membrane protein
VELKESFKEHWGGEDWHKIVALFIIGAYLRFSGMWRDIGFDESFTYLFSLEPIKFIIGGNDVHPPLHYLYVKPFALLLGNDIFMLRLTTLCIWGVFFLLSYNYIRQKFGNEIAFYSCIFLTLNPMLVYYSTELRMYMLLFTLFVLNLWAFDNWMKEKSVKNSILYIIPSVLMAYTHIYSGVIIAWQLGYALYKKTSIEDILITFGAVFSLSLPSIYLTFKVYLAHPKFYFLPTDFMSFVSTYYFMLSLPTMTFFFFFIFIGALIYHIIKLDLPMRGAGYYASYLLIPIPLYILGKFTTIYHHRYMSFIVIPLSIVIGIAIVETGKKIKDRNDFLLGLFIVAVFFTFISQTDPYFENTRNQNMLIADEHPTYPIIHTYPMSYLPYTMQFGEESNYLIGEYDFTLCGSEINPERKIYSFPEPPYYFVEFTMKHGELDKETIKLVEE